MDELHNLGKTTHTKTRSACAAHHVSCWNRSTPLASRPREATQRPSAMSSGKRLGDYREAVPQTPPPDEVRSTNLLRELVCERHLTIAQVGGFSTDGRHTEGRCPELMPLPQ